MLWRFTILDRDGIATVIDEPVGWDGNTSQIKRDPDYHGVFFTNQGETFEFYDVAMRLIKAEYDEYGFEGEMILVMEENCGAGYMEFSRGRFDFNKYEYTCGDSCFVKIPVEKSGEIVELRNRLNQKVNLEAVKAFDETTDLPVYSKLPFVMEFPSKAILLQNKAVNENLNGTPVAAEEDKILGVIEIGMTKTSVSEIGGFYFETEPKYTMSELTTGDPMVYTVELVPGDIYANIVPDYYSPTVNFDKDFTNVTTIGAGDIDTSWLIAGKIKALSAPLNDISLLFIKRSATDVYTELSKDVYFADRFLYLDPGNEIVFSKAYSDVLNLELGDRLYLIITVDLGIGFPHAFLDNAFEIEFNAGNYFTMTTASYTAPTDSKVFAINETISRVAESITNDRLRAYSEYFGRTDSQPYALPADGCGSLEVVTDGIRIRRQENKIPGTTNLFTLSLQDIFEGISPILQYALAELNKMEVLPCLPG